MKRICVYGKGGIGKSTAVSNLAAAMAQAGKRVAVVGCDPKADSTRGLMGRRIPTVLDQLKTGASGEIAFTDSRGVRCIEAGGPEPGTGCAGRGIIVAMEEIRSRGLLDDRDVVLYDVLGDVVCGGFSMPLREQVADEVYLVTTSDFMALYAANNICRGIRKYAHMVANRFILPQFSPLRKTRKGFLSEKIDFAMARIPIMATRPFPAMSATGVFIFTSGYSSGGCTARRGFPRRWEKLS